MWKEEIFPCVIVSFCLFVVSVNFFIIRWSVASDDCIHVLSEYCKIQWKSRRLTKNYHKNFIMSGSKGNYSIFYRIWQFILYLMYLIIHFLSPYINKCHLLELFLIMRSYCTITNKSNIPGAVCSQLELPGNITGTFTSSRYFCHRFATWGLHLHHKHFDRYRCVQQNCITMTWLAHNTNFTIYWNISNLENGSTLYNGSIYCAPQFLINCIYIS